MIGQTISHYKILEKLGGGGMGVVYKAEDTKLKRTVALKFLPPELTRDPAAKQRFIREAQTVSALDHPNICTVYEINETDDGRLFIAMACYEGQTLRDKVHPAGATGASPLPVDAAVEIAMQIAHGLVAAHKRGIVHRDLKPSNVVLTADGTAKILDFGLAKLTGETRAAATSGGMGTAAYMSPEQIRGEALDARTDVWSFGVLLFELLTGQLPFRGDHPMAMMYAVTNEMPGRLEELRPDVPSNVAEVVNRCLEKDSDRRPASVEEVLLMLRSGRPVPAKWFRVRPSAIRRIGVWSAGVAVIVIAAVWVWMQLARGPARSEGTHWRIAVLPVQNQTGSEATADWPVTLQAFMVENLTGVQGLGIVDIAGVNGLLGQSQATRAGAGVTDPVGLLRPLEVTFAVTGRVYALDSAYRVQIQVIDASTREVEFTQEAPLAEESGLPSCARALSENVINFLQVKGYLTEQDRDLLLRTQRTPDIRALKAYILASQYYYRGEPGSDEYLQRAIELDSMFVSPRVWHISGLVSRGRLEEARAQYAFLKRIEPRVGPADQALIAWVQAFLSNDLPGQARALETVLAYSPGNNILLYNLGYVKYVLADYEGAAAAVQPTIKSHWQYGPSYVLLAESYSKLGRFAEAKQTLEQLLTLPLVPARAYALLAISASRDRDSLAAHQYQQRYLAEAIAGKKPAHDAYDELGVEYLDQEFPKEALTFFTLASNLHPHEALYLEHMGDARLATGDTAAALGAYRNAVKYDSRRARVRYVIGTTAEALGEHSQAREQYQQYLKVDSVSARAVEVRQRLGALRN